MAGAQFGKRAYANGAADTQISVDAPEDVAAGDYQLLILLLASFDATFDPLPDGWDIIVDETVTAADSAANNSRLVVAESTTDTGPLVVPGTASRRWEAERLYWILPEGSPGRTTDAVFVNTAAGVSHSLPPVSTSTPDSVVIGIGGAEYSRPGVTWEWSSFGTFTECANNAGDAGPSTPENLCIGVGELAVASPATGVSGTWTLPLEQRAGMVSLVIDGADEGPTDPPNETLRLYMTSAAADLEPVSGALPFWTNAPSSSLAAPRLLGNSPAGESQHREATETSDAESFSLVGRWVTGPAQSDGEIPLDAWRMTMAAQESDAAADMFWVLGAWIMGTDGIREVTLVGAFYDVEWAWGEPEAREVLANFPDDPTTHNLPQEIFEGERLVLEIGYRATNTSTDPYTGTIYFGGTASPDLEHGDVGADLDRPSWIDIPVSPGLTFAEPEPPGDLTPASIRSKNTGSSASNTTTHFINMPPVVWPGDSLFVWFVNDEVGSSDDPVENPAWTDDDSWTILATLEQGESTNVRGTLFYKESATGNDTLVVNTEFAQESAHISYAVDSAGVPQLLTDDGGSTSGLGADIERFSDLPQDDYLSIVLLGIDSNEDGAYVPREYTPPAGWGDLVVSTPEVALDAVGTDRQLVDVTEIDPQRITWDTTVDQWVTFHVVIPPGTPSDEPDPVPVAPTRFFLAC